LKLYWNKLSTNSNRPLWLLKHLGLEHELVSVDLRAGDGRTPEYLAMNPNGKIPVLVDGDFSLWESNAILLYLARKYAPELAPSSPEAAADVDRWMYWLSNHLLAGIAKVAWNRLAAPMFGMPVDQAAITAGLADVERFAPILDRQIEARGPWILGDLSVVDFTMAPFVPVMRAAEIDDHAWPALHAYNSRALAQLQPASSGD
jgi:glutathione S-transferase